MTKQWNSWMPAKGSVPVKRHKLTLTVGGRVWTGHWEVEGDKLQVCSAYGSRTAPAAPEKTRVARVEALFAEIVARR
jgi:hypothetical protein